MGICHKDEGGLDHGRVKRRIVDVDGNPVGIFHDNVSLDSSQCEVEFDNGDAEASTANTIAENLLSQVDEEGHHQMLLFEMEDHHIPPDAIPKSGGTFTMKTRIKHRSQTTRG